MRKIILFLILCLASCVESEVVGDRADPDQVGLEPAAEQAQNIPPVVASCAAAGAVRELPDGTCEAVVVVTYSCVVATQVHDWTRVGLTGSTVDTTYACGGSVAETVPAPCADATVGAVFDDPVTGVDSQCLAHAEFLPKCSDACPGSETSDWSVDGHYLWTYCLPSYEECEK